MEPALPKVDSRSDAQLDSSSRKVDFATDLFNMLSMDGTSENGPESSSAEDSWAGFQGILLDNNQKAYSLFISFLFPSFASPAFGEKVAL